jgi:enoyl-CoA hydratase/carnithine racemase
MTTSRNDGQIRLVRISDAYWKVTFDIPPLNIFGPANIPQLEDIVCLLESDKLVKVVVFDSAVEGFFLYHYDFLAKPEDSAKFPVGRTGLQALPDMLARLSRAPVVSIASIRGRAKGVGSEPALACDMRFASRETAVLSQWEVGAALVPGGGPMARLPRLMGRGEHWKYCWVQTVSTAILPNCMAMSIVHCLIVSLTHSSVHSRKESHPSTGRRSQKRRV